MEKSPWKFGVGVTRLAAAILGLGGKSSMRVSIASTTTAPASTDVLKQARRRSRRSLSDILYPFTALAFSPHNRFLAAGDESGAIKICPLS